MNRVNESLYLLHDMLFNIFLNENNKYLKQMSFCIKLVVLTYNQKSSTHTYEKA